MANETRWTVLPHRPVEKLSERVWRVEGDLKGMDLKRVMTVARRADGGLVVHNAIALEEPMMKELDAWGPVRFIVVPNGYHRIDAPRFKARYPDAKVLCPKGARARVEQRVAVDGAYEDLPADEFVSLETLDGTGEGEGVMIVREGAGVGTTVVFNDAVFNMPHQPGFSGFVLRYVTASTGGPKVSRLARLALIKNKKDFAAHLTRIANLPGLARVIVSHHQTITDDPAGALRAVAASV